MQVIGNALYVGIGRRTINGHSGTWTGQVIDDFGGKGFALGGLGRTWGDAAYNGSIAWIPDLRAVADTPASANAWNTTPPTLTQALVQHDTGPFTLRGAGRLVVHSAGTRNPFGLCVDAAHALYFTNNFNRTMTLGNGDAGFDPRPARGAARRCVHRPLQRQDPRGLRRRRSVADRRRPGDGRRRHRPGAPGRHRLRPSAGRAGRPGRAAAGGRLRHPPDRRDLHRRALIDRARARARPDSRRDSGLLSRSPRSGQGDTPFPVLTGIFQSRFILYDITSTRTGQHQPAYRARRLKSRHFRAMRR